MKMRLEIYVDTDEERCWQKSVRRVQLNAIYELLMEKPMRWTELQKTLNIHRVTISNHLKEMLYAGDIHKKYDKEDDCVKYFIRRKVEAEARQTRIRTDENMDNSI